MAKENKKSMDDKIRAEDEIIKKKLEEIEAHKQKKKDLEMRAKECEKKEHDKAVADIGITLEKAIGRQLRSEDAEAFKTFLNGCSYPGFGNAASFFKNTDFSPLKDDNQINNKQKEQYQLPGKSEDDDDDQFDFS